MYAYPKVAIRFMWLVSVIGALVVALLAKSVPAGDWRLTDILFFALTIAVTEFLPVCLPNTGLHVTVSYPLCYAAAMVLGPAQGAAALLSGFLVANLILRGRMLADLYLFFLVNLANLGLSLAVSSLTYLWVGGTPISTGLSGQAGLSAMTPMAVTAGAAAYFLFNTTVCMLGSALVETRPVAIFVLANFRIMWPSYFFMTPFAALIAMLYMDPRVGMWTVVPFFVPFLALRQCLNLYTRRMQTYMDTVSMLGTMTMRYHPYTREHLEAVGMWSERLANVLRLPTRKAQAIRQAAVLHDVGKIGVGEIILDKTGKLSDEDWLLIKGHPVKGANILSKLKYFDEIVPWVMYHHERVDGRGYPAGLKAEEIPFEARIIAVADSFHAMMSRERSYRTPMSLEEAKEELRKGSGTQWDPDVIRAMLMLLETQ